MGVSRSARKIGWEAFKILVILPAMLFAVIGLMSSFYYYYDEKPPQPLTPEELAEQKAEQAKEMEERNRAHARGLVDEARASLKDPESGKFSQMYRGKEGKWICGRVNAKNVFGGYTGAQQFVYVDTFGLSFDSEEIDLVCNNKKSQLIREKGWDD